MDELTDQELAQLYFLARTLEKRVEELEVEKKELNKALGKYVKDDVRYLNRIRGLEDALTDLLNDYLKHMQENTYTQRAREALEGRGGGTNQLVT